MRKAIFVFLALILFGCAGSAFTWGQVGQLRLGMTKGQVAATMGEPTAKATFPEGEKWVWVHSGLSETKAVSVVFSGDTLSLIPRVPTE